MATETTTAQGQSPHPAPLLATLQPTALPSLPITPKSLSFDLDRLSPLVEDITSFPRIHTGVTITSVDNTKPVEGTAPQITETKSEVASDDPFAGQKGDVVNPFSTNGAKTGDVPVGSPPKNDRRLSSDEWGKLHDFFSLFFPLYLLAPLHAFTPFLRRI